MEQDKSHYDLATKFGEKIQVRQINGNEIHIITNVENIVELCNFIYSNLGCVLSTIICTDECKIDGKFVLRYVFGKNGKDVFFVASTKIDKNSGKFPTITTHIQSALLYEREIKDMFGLNPEGNSDQRPLVLHNWPERNYPLRKDFDINAKLPQTKNEYSFLRVGGNGICEIPVGPVHAGIIEPGHFRFSMLGENITNLETRLFYTHRGVEKMAEQMPLEDVVLLSERIAGDESVANSTAFCQAVEKIAQVSIPKNASQTRTVFAEIERIYNHLGTLAGITTDTGFAFGAARLNILKEKAMQLNEKTSGSRILFGVNRIGGVKIKLTDSIKKIILSDMEDLENEFDSILEFLKKKSSFVDRLKNTGVITKEDAVSFGIVGVAARCVGIDVDTRKDHPYASYSSLHLDKHETPYQKMQYQVELQKRNGDALSRFMVRAEEIKDSMTIIRQTLHDLDNTDSLFCEIGQLEQYSHALGYAESHRGQTIHWMMAGQNNSVYRYKVRTASFCNWKIIEQAILNDIIADFPIVNKSLDLSYAGNDL